MKKIIVFAAIALLSQGILFAQNGKAVSDKDVPERYVKDFNRLVPDVKNVDWRMIDTLIYDANYVNDNGTRTAYRFSPKGTETLAQSSTRSKPTIRATKSKSFTP